MNGANEILKRTAAMSRRRPGPQPPVPSHNQLLLELYKAALTGVMTQFETGLPYHKPYNIEGVAELARARTLTRRAWNSAIFAVALFEEDANLTTFGDEMEIQ